MLRTVARRRVDRRCLSFDGEQRGEFEELIVAAVFTGTFGIFLLLTLQVLAAVVTAFSGFSTSSLAMY